MATSRFRAMSGPPEMATVMADGDGQDLKKAWTAFETDGREFWEQMDELVDMLDGVVAREVDDAREVQEWVDPRRVW